uniref:Uncharacterized protein n=1 Tax=Anguilla anguilla TaxID=7936 RepID=A0A0E9QE75_ANGAN
MFKNGLKEETAPPGETKGV